MNDNNYGETNTETGEHKSIEDIDRESKEHEEKQKEEIENVNENIKIKALSRRLKLVAKRFDAMKKSGIDEEILIIFLHDKTGFSKRDIKTLITSQEEFFNKLIKKS